MYNSSILSLYTPDTFPLKEEYEEEYNRILQNGKDYSSMQRVIITTMVRDVSKRLPEIKRKAEMLGKIFRDYRILIVENDSKDGTRGLLLDWASENNKVIVLGCGYNEDECSIKNAPKTEGHTIDKTRIDKMSMLRNIYLQEIKKTYYDWDYVIMWDLDLIGSIYLDGVIHSFGYLDENKLVDVVCAYGIYRWLYFKLFYDTYALIEKDDNFHINNKLLHDIKKRIEKSTMERGQEPQEVESCFSGFAIYRTSSLLGKDVFYDNSIDDNIECEHYRLKKKIKGKKVINPSMINIVILND